MTIKKHVAAAAIGFAISAMPAAQAVTLNPKGLGQALVYPYYTVNKSQDTLLSVVNTADIGKVTRVRFMEGRNGRPVLDFLVFLSPHDVWSARVSQTSDDGGARIFTSDNSCTYPSKDNAGNDMRGNGIPFRASAYTAGGAYPADGGPTSITRTREGHVEIIADGDIVPGSPTDRIITHVQAGTPNAGIPGDCNKLASSSYKADMVTPTSDLGGSAVIINVGEGTFYAYNADALNEFTSVAFTDDGSVLDYDSLLRANSAGSTYPGGAIAVLTMDGNKPLSLDYRRGIDAVSAVFMADAISNDYLVDASLGANTDWIITLPTKRFYTDPAFATSGSAQPPFYDLFLAPGISNVGFGFRTYDREEGTTTDCDSGCPAQPPKNLPYEVNALTFSDPTATQASGVLGSALTTRVASYGNSGWAQLDLNPAGEPHLLTAGTAENGTSVVLKGLPVTGFMVYNVINSNAQPGKLANYSGLFPHRANVSCSGAVAGCTP
jgi:hypothetical protein